MKWFSIKWLSRDVLNFWLIFCINLFYFLFIDSDSNITNKTKYKLQYSATYGTTLNHRSAKFSIWKVIPVIIKSKIERYFQLKYSTHYSAK